VQRAAAEEKPDLIFLTFAKPHFESYLKPVRQFEQRNNVRIRMELVGGRALQSRLQSALLAGTLLAIVPPAILFFALQREFVAGLTSGAVKG